MLVKINDWQYILKKIVWKHIRNESYLLYTTANILGMVYLQGKTKNFFQNIHSEELFQRDTPKTEWRWCVRFKYWQVLGGMIYLNETFLHQNMYSE